MLILKNQLLLTRFKFTGSKSAPSYISVHTKVSDLTYDPLSALSGALLPGQLESEAKYKFWSANCCM